MTMLLMRREWFRNARFFGFLALGLVLFSSLIVAIYPTMHHQMETMLTSLPSFFKPFVQSKSGLGTFEGFVDMLFGHPLTLALLGAWPISMGAGAIAGEIERSTLGWMLSYPVSRTSYLLSKAMVMIGGIAALAFLFLGSAAIAAKLYGIPHASWVFYARASFVTFLLYAALGSLTLWASAALSERGPAALLGTSLMLAMYLVNYIAQIWDPLKPVQWLSLFAFYDPKALLYGNDFDLRHLAVLSGVGLAGLTGAVTTFRFRQLSI